MIPEKNPYNNWQGNGSATTFDFDFYIENEGQLAVYHTNNNGVQTRLVYNRDYSIHEFENENGSYITFPLKNSSYSVLGDGEVLSLCLTLPISQLNPFGKSSYLDLKTLEYSLDYLTRLCQIMNRELERSVKTQEGSSQSADELIEALQQAQVNAQNSASAAALSAQEANNSAIAAGEEATIATQQAAIVEETYNTAIQDIAQDKSDAISAIASARSSAESSIAVNKEDALTTIISYKTDAVNLMATTKTNAINQIQALGIYMKDDRLFYRDTQGIEHEFRNDFGGIAPMAVKHKEIEKTEEGFALTWTDPDDSTYQSNVYCRWNKTVIRRKLGSYPASPFDGDEVLVSTVRNQYAETPYIDEVDTSLDYKYRAFPCSLNNVYNLEEINKFGQWIYSFTRLMNESVPSEKIVYRGTNEFYKPAYMDFSSDTFKYEDWKNAPFLLKDRLAPCVVGFDGELQYFLNPNNYKEKEDGSPSDVTNTGLDINCFMRIKLLFRRKRKNANGDTEIDISNVQVNDEYKPYGGFVKPDGTLREYIYLPIYRGSLINGKCRSMSGNLTPMSSQTAQNERNYCQANGAGHDMITHADREILEDLYMLMFKNTDSQSALGQGKSNGGSDVGACLKSGTMDDKGLFYGSTSTAVGIKMFGMENRYASQWERVLGEVLVNGVRKVKLCQGTSDGSTVEDFNFTGEGYITLSELPTITGSSGGYISKEQTVDDIGTFPIVISGSSSTNECDGMWYNNSGTMVAIRGGDSYNGALCGVFCSNLNNPASYAYWNIGSSVSYKPL